MKIKEREANFERIFQQHDHENTIDDYKTDIRDSIKRLYFYWFRTPWNRDDDAWYYGWWICRYAKAFRERENK
jgi:hypothetical protein